MSAKTARKYLSSGQLPSEMKQPRHWRTRQNPFEEDWEEIENMLDINPGLFTVTLFQHLQRQYPGKYQDGQLRSFQDHVNVWRATKGPSQEVFFPQRHEPGRLCQSDFTSLNHLNITIAGQRFHHLIYHFVLTYSNWETGMVCFSESFESLSEGFQSALWELGKVPVIHRSDQLSAAIKQSESPDDFTQRYKALLNHYQVKGEKIQVGKPNQNGDIEQRHRRFKEALDQALMLRGSREFESRKDYESFLQKLFKQLNSGRSERLKEELAVMKALPAKKLDLSQLLQVTVRPSSTIKILRNVYSVKSQLKGKQVSVKVKSDHLQIWFGRHLIETLPRLRGRDKHRIDYRHIIDSLVKKPGAFEQYLYKEDLFPNSRFRMIYDVLKVQLPDSRANKEYLQILYLAAQEGESKVDKVLHYLLREGLSISAQLIHSMLKSACPVPRFTEVHVEAPNLKRYDTLFQDWQVEICPN